MHWFLKFFPKFIVFLLIFLCVYVEWREGYFRGVKVYFRTRAWLRSIRMFLLFSLLTLCLLPADGVLLRLIQHPDHGFFSWLEGFGKVIGRNINPWAFIVTGYVLMKAVRRDRWARMAFGALVSSGVAVIIAQGFKYSICRARPAGNYGAYSFFNLDGLLRDDNVFQSFPSGDVASVAGIAAFLFFTARGYFWRWFFVLLPLATAYSRISLDRHWPSDTFFSIGLGFTVARLFSDYQSFKTGTAK